MNRARWIEWEKEKTESTLWMLVWGCGVQCTYKHTRQSPAIRFFMIRPVDLGPPLKVKHQIPLLFSFCSSFFEAVDSFLQQEDSQGKLWRGNLQRDKGRALCIAFSRFVFCSQSVWSACTAHTASTGPDSSFASQAQNAFAHLSPVLLLFWFVCRRYMVSKLGFSPGEAAKGQYILSQFQFQDHFI